MKAKKILRLDSKGRICLGAYAKGVNGYKAMFNENTREIVLQPYTEIPLAEQWLFKNKATLDQIKRGLKQSASKKTVYKGSFVHHLDKEEDEL